MSDFSINTQKMIKMIKLLSSRIAMATARIAPKFQEIKTFMADLGLCQIWASKRRYAH